MCTKTELDTIIEKIVRFSKDLFGDKFQSVILYGSYARGDYDEESDIDIMIMVDMSREELAYYRRKINNFCADLDLDNDVFLSPKLQSVQFFKEWENVLPFYQNVLREGVRYA
ncbi:MAG: nucleotidyltransferase domain-containing protein [Clostridia bacterium]|nr:nucleotidyltransferase domain-containing protein [Clostridia bacterium]